MKFKCPKGSIYNESYKGFIYKTTNLENGKWYIGMHHQIDDPNDPYDENYVGSGKIITYAINKAIEELGENWRTRFTREILDPGPYTWEETAELEDKYILEYNAVEDPMSYNSANNAHPPINNRYGTILINNGEIHKYIKECDLDLYLKRGWVKGRTKEVCKKISLSNSGKSHRMINLPSYELMREKAIRNFSGPKTEDHKKHLSSALKSYVKTEDHKKHLSESQLGNIRVTNGIENTSIKESELERYESLGWYKGVTRTKESIKHVVDSNKKREGCILINNGEVNKQIRPEDFEHYQSLGWKRGRKKKSL